MGCTSSSSCAVTGEVTFQDQPLDDALIRFQPVGSGHQGGGQAEIKAGIYQIDRLSPGEYRVWITAERKTGRKVRQPDVEVAGAKPLLDEETVQIIPMQYNVRTKLRVTLEPGDSQHDFELSE